MKKEHKLLLGAHMSIAGGFEKAIERGESIHCTAIQIFTKSNRQWHANPITQGQAELFKQRFQHATIKTIVAHASYLINLASPDQATRQRSIRAAVDELERCATLGIPYLVVHPGAHIQAGIEKGLELIVESVEEILRLAQNNTVIVLENMAGQGSTTCFKFEHIAFILQKLKHPKRLGVCFDTCHAFAAGYSFSTPLSYQAMWQEFDAIVGMQYLKVIHLNDSKKALGSQVDRHEDIGKGAIGIEAFKLIINDPRLFDVPKILETPNETLEGFAKNMQLIKNEISAATKKELNLD